jgi:mRNA-degrading endonuclease YafQ of YafQ-DinJ toxin-antitoxin module
MEIAFSSSFKRSFKKKIKGRKEIEDLFWEVTALFMLDPLAIIFIFYFPTRPHPLSPSPQWRRGISSMNFL